MTPVWWATPGDLAKALDPRTVQTPALDLIDAALVQVAEGKLKRLIISMPPQAGKVERASRRFPLWLLTRNPNLRIVIASYTHAVAQWWGRTIRSDIATHGETLGLGVRDDIGAAHDWRLARHAGGVRCVGVGGAFNGPPIDVLVIDDPHKNREEAESQACRDAVWSWWTDVARTRLAPDASVVLAMSRRGEDDFAGRLLRDDEDSWTVIDIPAQGGPTSRERASR